MTTRPSAARLLIVAIAAMLLAAAVGKSAAQETPDIPLEAVMDQEARSLPGGSVRPPADAVTNAPQSPGIQRPRDAEDGAAGVPALGTLGANSDATLWGEIRAGETFSTQAPGPTANFLVQDAGMGWQALRAKDGPLQHWGARALIGILAVLVLFYILRGRVKVDHGLSGNLIERFKGWERFGHWLLAISFVLLALTGLNLLFGKDYLMPLIGKETFATVTIAGKWVHNNVAWPFMIGLVWVFLAWVWHNIPGRTDLRWIIQGGGLIVPGVHPPARKFNFGQKIIFWMTILLGASVSASGLSLLFPYELAMFGPTFEKMNAWGISEAVLGRTLATDLTLIQEMQYAQLWHTIVALAMMVIIIAHIYIGSVGMQGAFDAMGSGMVDRNWALEHHQLWVEEKEAREGRRSGGPATGPATGPAE